MLKVNQPKKDIGRNNQKHRGFALMVTLSLMILLVILAVGLLSLSTVSLRSTSQEIAQSEARANARLALILALGDLQKLMGPDARISARAETLAKDKRLGATIPSNTAKAWWVGVSHSDREKPVGPGTAPVVWLISGLDPNSSPASQISGTFKDPVSMYGDNSIDMASLTGGQPIQAGKVMIYNTRGGNTGAFAYFIDDNGMKAQLAASDPKVTNDRRPPYGGGVLTGTYDLSILKDMNSLEGKPRADYFRLLSINDLPLIGADKRIARTKRLGYTTLSLGVLSDVRKGGLKRDLTIAFEKDDVFANVFPKGSSGFDPRYIVMDAKKFGQASELKSNGYIHWEMFKDFYNIKKSIRKVSGLDTLDTVLIDKNDIFNDNSTPFARGQLGPHAIGPNNNVQARHQPLPYGDYVVIPAPSSTDAYKHSPVIPILSRLQQNAWVERVPAVGRNGKEMLRTHVQLWTSQYNPYNINLDVLGDNARYGPRITNYPQVYFSIPGVQVRNDQGNIVAFNNISGFNGKRQTSVPHEILLGPGRSHVCAFKASGAKDQGLDDDEFLFDDKVRDLTLQSLYDEFEVTSGLSGRLSLSVNFVLERPSMIQGANSNSYSANHEVAQTMWAPFAWDAISNRPGKKITKSAGASELNENTMASLAFNLRTTREGRGAIRPLVDANIRAILCNPKWDSPLGLDLLAAYSPENRGETDEQIFQMNTRDAPKGYTYWGAGNGPPDGHDRVILFDIPREDLVSLGQLQHAGVGRFSYEPSYIVGNSHANLRIPSDDWRTSVRDTFSTPAHGLQDYVIPGSFNLYDASYLVNEELWDSYVFTTIPQVADNYGGGEPVPNDAHFKALLKRELLLPNPRFIPYEPPGSKFDKATLQMTTGTRGATGGFHHNAGHLLVDGSFNVNSTSIDAWEAFLSGTHKLAYQKLAANGSVSGFSTAGEVAGVRFPRVKSVLGKGMETNALDENFWTGFRSLKPEEVRALAEAIVAEIRKRGPFLTMGEFVNRRLETGELGQRGALQTALDATVNKDLDSDFGEKAGNSNVPADSTQGAGFPGQLQQGDILQSLSPYMTVRSDSFTIRAYGESRSPATNEIRARAWCEATVQRYPDPVPDSGVAQSSMDALVNPAGKFGRSFRILSFRWLSPNEI